LVIDTADQAALLGVHFRPGGASFFFTPPAGELHNAQVSLDTLWGPKADELRERVIEARSPAAKFRVLEQFLLTQAVRPLVRHPAVAFALREFHDSQKGFSGSVGLQSPECSRCLVAKFSPSN
jgi:hypothetical protein